jgi:hypothetical protein
MDRAIYTGARLGEGVSSQPRRRSHYRQRKHCPLCLDSITDGADACRSCRREWDEIRNDPARLAEWIVYAQEERELLGGTVVWRKKG